MTAKAIKMACTAAMVFLLPQLGSAQFSGSFEIERHYLAEENFFDWKAYREPVNWRYDWYETANGMRTATGSISMDRFYFEHEIRLEADLGKFATFLYEQRQESLFGNDPIYREAEFRFGRKYYYSFIGFPHHEKRYANIGHALSWGERDTLKYVRFSRLNQFAVYNEKNDGDDKRAGNDRYVTTPVLYRLEAKYPLFEKLFAKLDYRNETETLFQSDEEDREKRYEGADIRLVADWHLSKSSFLGLSLRRDRERRELRPLSGSGDLSSDSQVLEFDTSDLYWFFPIFEKDFLTVGYLDGRFANDIGSDETQIRYDFHLSSRQLYSKWQHWLSDGMTVLYGLQMGDYKIYKKKGGILDQDDKGVQIKATVGLIIYREERLRFQLVSTWDLDIVEERAWDGGNVTLQLRF